MKSLAVLVCMALAGLGAAKILDLHQIHQHSSYVYIITALLAIGLYSSTSGIPIAEMKRNGRTILLAVTIGVVAKAALIAGVLLLVAVDDPIYAVLLGVAVAQIDPLAVAALVGKSRMSDSAKTVLRAWSSFDDPVTMIITVYLLTFAGWSGAGTAGADPFALAGSFAENLGFALAVWIVYRMLGRLPEHTIRIAGLCLLLVVGIVAVAQFYLLGLAVIGLFLRPLAGAVLDRVTWVSLGLATAALGMLLVGGVNWVTGIWLGVAAYCAQAVLAPLVARRHSRTDRIYLALGQQNGITAITLALLAEPVFPQTVGVIAPAILVINGMHAMGGAAWDGIQSIQSRVRVPQPEPDPVPLSPPIPVVGAVFGGFHYVYAPPTIARRSSTGAR